jgi:hypothetical protein
VRLPAFPPYSCGAAGFSAPRPSAFIRGRFFRSRRYRASRRSRRIGAFCAPTLPRSSQGQKDLNDSSQSIIRQPPQMCPDYQMSLSSDHQISRSPDPFLFRVSVPPWWVFLFCFSISRLPDYSVTQFREGIPPSDPSHPNLAQVSAILTLSKGLLFSASPLPPRWLFLFCFSIFRLPDCSIADPGRVSPIRSQSSQFGAGFSDTRVAQPPPAEPFFFSVLLRALWRRIRFCLFNFSITRLHNYPIPGGLLFSASPCLRGGCSCFAFLFLAFADFFDWRLLSLVPSSQELLPGF